MLVKRILESFLISFALSSMFSLMIIERILEFMFILSNKWHPITSLTFQKVQYPIFLSFCLVLGNTTSAKQSLRLLPLQNLATGTLGNTASSSLLGASNK